MEAILKDIEIKLIKLSENIKLALTSTSYTNIAKEDYAAIKKELGELIKKFNKLEREDSTDWNAAMANTVRKVHIALDTNAGSKPSNKMLSDVDKAKSEITWLYSIHQK